MAVSYTHLFYRFYRAKMLAPHAKPNAAHKKLAQWEKEGKLKAVITQNIDGLHQAAGSKTVLELHGSTPVSYTHLDVYKRQVRGIQIHRRSGRGLKLQSAQGHDVSDRESVRIKHMGKGKKD